MSALVFPLAALGAYVKSKELFSQVRIDESVSGKEWRSSWWGSPKWRYMIGFDVLRSSSGSSLDYQQLLGHSLRHFGQLDSFLLMDPEDHTVTAHGFGVGDGITTSFQLQRSMLGDTYDANGGPWAELSTQRTNLCLQSQDFGDALWSKSGCTISANSVVAPDGTTTADKVIESALNQQHYISSAAFSVTSGLTYTLSIFAHATGDRSQFRIDLGGSSPTATFDVAAGTILSTTDATAHIYASSNGWYRCALTFTSAATTAYTLVASLGTYSGNGVSYIPFWGAQAEVGRASRYIATLSSAGVVVPSYWPSYMDGFEPIYDPSPGPSIYVNGALQVLTTDYTIGTTGLVTFTATHLPSDTFTWTGTYYRRVRMETGSLSHSRLAQGMWSAEVSLVSVKP